MRFANLPWYDFSELRGATDAFWVRLRDILRASGVPDLPNALNRDEPFETQWRSSRFIFGQACGFDLLRAPFDDHLQPVATPVYEVPGCVGPTYRSYLIVAAQSEFSALSDLRAQRCIVNSVHSHSGMNGLGGLLSKLGRTEAFFRDVAVSGSHEASFEAVVNGQAEIAAIDCVSFAHLRRRRELEGRYRIIGETLPLPAPPFVTSTRTSESTLLLLRKALQQIAVENRSQAICRELKLKDIRVLPASAYGPILEMYELHRGRWLGAHS